MNKAVFFDRDDTLIKNIPYLGDPSKVTLLPGAHTAVSKLKKAGFLLVMITNQSGVGRGLISREQVKAVNDEVMRKIGIEFDAVYICFDHPDTPKENCRKPSPKMVLQAQKELHIDPSASFFIGDTYHDIVAGNRAGCRTILLEHSHNKIESRKAESLANLISNDLAEIAGWILSQNRKT